MSIDEEYTTTGGTTATAVGERPVRGPRAAGGVAAPPRPGRVPRRPAPARPGRATRPAPATGPVPAVGAAPAARRPSAARHAPRAPFVLLVVGLLCGGLVSLLLLNTVLTQDSFRVQDLRESTRELHDQKQDLYKKFLTGSQPGTIADNARKGGVKPDTSAPEILTVPGAQPSRAGVAVP
ncbi:hypothetical protein DQ384_00415 [Sphaerisporangium album]|uniref:Cell division protein FtsL n=1 Tax=Sphaerisporangium album TaxID=509200 RepID=A0A367FTN4_9ACTN|nr:hypothetical protein [Sphaerisporangium album]RCG32955.1 hypothetical protein DQ384_00415 [Sphaerisporangium album]